MSEKNHHPAGTTLWYGLEDAVPTLASTSIQFTQVHDAELPFVTRGESDDTALDNDAAVGTNSSGWGKPDKFKLTVYHRESQYAALKAVERGRQTRPFRIQFPTVGSETVGTYGLWSGWFESVKISPAIVMDEKKYMDECNGQMTGDISFTVGTPSA